jgi:hypothetical protein
MKNKDMISYNKISMGLFNDSKNYANSQKTKEEATYKELNLNDIVVVDFPDNQYVREQTNKNQIVLHHTVSGQGVDGDISWWRQTVERIGTAIIIGWDGNIYQSFSSKYWSYHLGLKTSNNKLLNQKSMDYSIHTRQDNFSRIHPKNLERLSLITLKIMFH